MNKEQEILKRLNKAKCIHAEASELIADLEKELTEAEKPKPLEHGDCGWSGDSGYPYIVQNNHDRKDYGMGEKGGQIKISETGFKVAFNAFADLKAISEPLEEFKFNDLKVSIDKDRDWRLEQGDDVILFRPEDIHDFILKLRRMETKMLAETSK